MQKFYSSIALIGWTLLAFTTSSFAQQSPTQDYLLYVLSESADKISLIRFGANVALNARVGFCIWQFHFARTPLVARQLAAPVPFL